MAKTKADPAQCSAAGRKGMLVRWGTKRKRCPCGVSTLARAQARGHENVHAPSCTFYKKGKKKYPKQRKAAA